MVGILRALKVTLFFFLPITLSLVAFIMGVSSFVEYNGDGTFSLILKPLPIILLIAGGFFFVLFLIKAVGDIAEEALTYYE